MIRIEKGNPAFRSVEKHFGKIGIAFGVYRWPWIERWCFYNTILAQVIDETGILNWLAHFKRGERDTYRFVHIRLLCVAVAVKWNLAGEVAHG